MYSVGYLPMDMATPTFPSCTVLVLFSKPQCVLRGTSYKPAARRAAHHSENMQFYKEVVFFTVFTVAFYVSLNTTRLQVRMPIQNIFTDIFQKERSNVNRAKTVFALIFLFL